MLDLPLRVARLHRQADSESRQVVDAYQLARSQYEEWASTAAGTLIEIDSKAHLADVANELGEPHVAIRQLQDLEKELITLKSPQRDPAEVRFGIARVLARVEGMSDSSVATLKSIVSDYPTSAFAPRALLNLASEAATRGEVEESLGYLDRLSSEFPQASLANAKALLTRARLLEKHDRWREAVDAYRTLPVSHPLTREALEAPLEIVAHYVRVGDDTERDRALVRAEKDYLKFIERFTDGPLTQFARYQLVQTLIVQERFSEALSGLIELSESSAGTRLGAAYKLQAAKLANDLGDSTRARAIIDEIQSQYGKGRRDTNSVINNTEAQSP